MEMVKKTKKIEELKQKYYIKIRDHVKKTRLNNLDRIHAK